MVKLVLSHDYKKIGVFIGGENFNSLLHFLKEYSFKFEKDPKGFGDRKNLWIRPVSSDLKDIIDDLQKVEPFYITEEVKNHLVPVPETEYLRMNYNPSFLTTPPLGEYQERTIRQGIRQTRCYLAHKQGLGKTYMAFGILNHLVHSGSADRCLILCRPEGVYNLKRELLRFQTFGIAESDIYIADAKHRKPLENDPKVIICTYRTFLMLCDDAYKSVNNGELKKKYQKPPIDFSSWGKGRVLFLDEAHSLKNRQARWSRAVKLESGYFRFRYLMSGTPYPRGIEDLWEQFNIMDENVIGLDYFDFLEKIAVLGTRFSAYQIARYKEDEIQKLLERIKPWMIREFATDNLTLPEQIEEFVYVEMSDKQKKIYQQYVSQRLKIVMQDKKPQYVMREVYRDFPHIQQAVIDPCMLKGKIDRFENPKLYDLVEKWKFEDSTRVEVCDSLVENELEKEHKVIIWSGHPVTIMNLAEHYKKEKAIAIYGEMEVPSGISKDAYIDELIEEFKKDSEKNILIASYFMISTSKNITEANTMIYFDNPWDFSCKDQSKERNHRPTSTYDSIMIYDLVAQKTIEERQMRVLTQRRKLDEELLKYDSLSKEQWREIFEGEEID